MQYDMIITVPFPALDLLKFLFEPNGFVYFVLLCCLNKTVTLLTVIWVLQNSRPSSYSSKSRSTPAKARQSPVVSSALAESPSSWEKVIFSFAFFLYRVHCFLKNSNLGNAVYLFLIDLT